jgi:transposase
MTKTYSLDLRERVAERVAAGDRVRAVATIFSVSVASVVRWVESRVIPGGEPMRGAEYLADQRVCSS